MSTTRPVASSEMWESYCESLGVPAGDARMATVTYALMRQLQRLDAALAPRDPEQVSSDIDGE